MLSFIDIVPCLMLFYGVYLTIACVALLQAKDVVKSGFRKSEIPAAWPDTFYQKMMEFSAKMTADDRNFI